MTEQPPSASKEALDLAKVDYTERALTVARDAIEGVPDHLLPYRINSEEIAQAIAPDIADALSERDAAYLAKLSECEDFRAGFATVERQCRDANRALRQARSEHAALLARLREPDVREALEVELRPYLHEMLTLEARDTVLTAALTKIDNFFARKLATRRASVGPTGTGEQPASPGERDAAAIRAFGKGVWSDTEEVAYQAGVSDTREKLQEAKVREAAIEALRKARWPRAAAKRMLEPLDGMAPGIRELYEREVGAIIARIAEMLK